MPSLTSKSTSAVVMARTFLYRELSEVEVKRLMTPKRKPVQPWEPVLYRGLEPSKDVRVARYTLEKTMRKVVDELDANLLIQHGWVIVDIDDPDDDDG